MTAGSGRKRSGSTPVRTFLGLGGNLGEPAAAMAAALQALDAHEGVSVVAVSSLYRTPPWGMTDQPDFLNAVAELRATLPALDLLALCLDTERALKRVRSERWGPRLIDMDILFYGGETIELPELQVPHPRMNERGFVLAPLAEIAPELDLQGYSAAERLSRVEQAGILRLPAGHGWWQAKD